MQAGSAMVLHSTVTMALEFLFPEGAEQPDGRYSGTYIDCTFGDGMFAEHILSRLSDSARLFAFDIDPESVALGQELESRDSRFHIFHRPYTDMGKLLQGEKVHGIVCDVGISALQNEKDCGLACMNLDTEDGPLDLRLNP